MRLATANPDWDVRFEAEHLANHPALVIWSIDAVVSIEVIQQEVTRLEKRWQPAPLLLLLPPNLPATREQLLSLSASGLLQNCDLNTLTESIQLLLTGGRVVRLKVQARASASKSATMSFGQSLLVSGLRQINNELRSIEAMLNPSLSQPLLRLLLEGRSRELRSAREVLLVLWGPLRFGFEDTLPARQPLSRGPAQLEQTAITLRGCNATAIWEAIRERLDGSVQAGLSNATGRLLAIEGLHPERRRELLLALLQQLDRVLIHLRTMDHAADLHAMWVQLQLELRQRAITAMVGSYVQIPRDGELRPVVAVLLEQADLSGDDGELLSSLAMLAPLLVDQPVLVNGQLLPSYDPRALLQMETLVSNWLVRTAELIGSELLESCGRWPELRRYLLCDPLLATRELDRLRNRLNTQMRWSDWIERPIQLYESRRMLFQLRQGRIEPLQLTEPRDQELNQLGWWQRQVALLLEIRDALAPQVQVLVRRFGDLAAVFLTQVLGRAIGLVSRGMAQGMGRSLSRN
ncbi:DUF3685 domain-containing protein [Synechococcus sp. M16CYN]|uniref:DUF3685 domain-containing protein n=1 Tax=Synechococcus sp. M16CYN TaxID=3103139 RepID=UPI0030DDE07F